MQKFCILVNDKFSHNDIVSLPKPRMNAKFLHLGKMTNSVTMISYLGKWQVQPQTLCLWLNQGWMQKLGILVHDEWKLNHSLQ